MKFKKKKKNRSSIVDLSSAFRTVNPLESCERIHAIPVPPALSLFVRVYWNLGIKGIQKMPFFWESDVEVWNPLDPKNNLP